MDNIFRNFLYFYPMSSPVYRRICSNSSSRRIFSLSFFCMINYMLQVANPTSQFKTKLKELLEEYKNVISLDSMGFPKGWEEEKMWED